MKRILVVFGTRPEAIKMCPVVKELKKSIFFDVKVCSTGQHQRMLKDVLKIFDIEPEYDLNIMKEKQDLYYITMSILDSFKGILSNNSFDLVLVHGDTTTAFATALACFYQKIPIGHVEAGLRSGDLISPYPEEFNRKVIDIICDIYFAPTQRAKENLLKEGVNGTKIFVTGNTGIDALNTTVRKVYDHPELQWSKGSRLILLTAHRRENIGEPMKNMFRAIRQICKEEPDVKVIFPIHLNPLIREIANEILSDCSAIHMIEPLDAVDFHNFINHCYLILTDSGGIQEEASALGKPVLVMRTTTERMEGIEAGTLRLVGVSEKSIYVNTKQLLNDQSEYMNMSKAVSPYGNGHAAEKITRILERLYS